MQLTFKTVDDVIFKIEVDPAEKVKDLKKKLQNDRGTEYNAEGMKLLFAGKILDDEKTISDYSINDKGFIVIMVPRPKTPGKESGKKPHSHPTHTPVISTIPENTPLAFDALFPSTSPPNPAIPLDYPQWQGQEHPPRSGNSSDNEASSGLQGKLFESQVSSESGLPARRPKRQSSARSNVSSESSRRVAAMLRDGAVSPRVRPASSTASDEVSPMASHVTHEMDVLTSPLQCLDEESKRSEVSNWLDKMVVEEPTSMLEHSLNADETFSRNVQTVVEMGFEKEQAETALNASFNSVEGALEYLVAGFPPAEHPEPRVPSFAWMPPVVQQPHLEAYATRDIDDDPLEFLRTDEEFQCHRLAVLKDPDLLPSALESFRSSRSDLEPVFEAFVDRLVELLTEPVDDSQRLLPASVAMDTTHSSLTDLLTPGPPESQPPGSLPAEALLLHMESHCSRDRLDPLKSSLTDTDRLLDLPAVSDDSTSSSPVPSYGERRVPPVGEDASAFETPHEEDVSYGSFGDEEEEKLTEEEKQTEELIRALLLQDQEEQERAEAERRAVASETPSWSDVEALGSGIAGGVGRTSGGIGGRGGSGGRTLEDRGYVRVTLEEKQAIDRLKALGFTEERVVQLYLACEKNEEMAANILLDKD